ncbi:uncharacterized protein [Montipora capricornis]|uniref:uncharacterized protein n=1 Tax=Montipora capricornis TaxID=246305 RepID=UPI0035F182A4
MPGPHFCNFCKNHGVSTRVTHAHRASCPWKDCVCLNCTRTRHRNSYHRNLRNIETSTVTSTTTTPVAAVAGTLGTVSAANVLAVANSGQKASATSVAAARAAKAKRLKDENKNEQMNRFVNNFMANLSEEEKKLPFLTNHARALRAYSEGSMQRTENHGQVTERQPSAVMALTQLEAAFPHIPFTTLEQLFRECGENVNTVLDHLTTNEASGQAQLQQPMCTMTVDDCENLRRLSALFPQFSNMLDDCFSSFSFDFGKTVDFLVSLTSSSTGSSSSPLSLSSPSSLVLSFSGAEDSLPSSSALPDPLSSFLSFPEGHTSGRRPFRCPHCGYTCEAQDFHFCPHCGHPLDGRPRL